MTRVLHISDLHFLIPWDTVAPSEWLNKRAVGGMNQALRRGRHYTHAEQRMSQFAEFLHREAISETLISGDLTVVGATSEFENAKRAMTPVLDASRSFIIAGNHDHYVKDNPDAFAKVFSKEVSRRDLPLSLPNVALGEHAAVVAVRSTRPSTWVWQSTGLVEADELTRLQETLSHPLLQKRRVLVMTHYGFFRADGSEDGRFHRLDNAHDVLRVVQSFSNAAIIHGHIHRRFFHARTPDRPWIFCAGSSTFTGREGGWVYDFGSQGAHAGWNAQQLVLRAGRFELDAQVVRVT